MATKTRKRKPKETPQREKFEAWFDGLELASAVNLFIASGLENRAEFVRASVLSGNFNRWQMTSEFIGRAHQALNDISVILRATDLRSDESVEDCLRNVMDLQSFLISISQSNPERGE